MSAAALATATERWLEDAPDQQDEEGAPDDEPSAAAIAEASFDALAEGVPVADRERQLAELERDARDPRLDDLYRLYVADVRRRMREQHWPMTHAQAVDAARRGDTRALVEGNLPLALSVVRHTTVRNREQAIMDLVQEANLGLWQAAERYDWQRGFTFATYAIWWVRRYCWNEAGRQANPGGLLSDNDRNVLGVLRRRRRKLEAGELDAYLAEGEAPPPLGMSLAEAVAWLHAHAVPPPKRMTRWPTPSEVAGWLRLSCQLLYLSEHSPSHAMLPPSHTLGHSTPSTIGELLRAPELLLVADPNAYRLPERKQRRDVQRMADLLAQLSASGLLPPTHVTLVALRFGIPHPDPEWAPPDGWLPGSNHSRRWVAGYWSPRSPSGSGTCGEGTTVRRHAQTVLACLRDQPDGSPARELLALIELPALLVQRVGGKLT